jgi:hypothetical protein
MCARRAFSLVLIVSAGLAASAYAAFAQSFDERWSVVPKAKAEEAQPPAEDSGLLPKHTIDRSVGFNERASSENRTERRATRSGRAGDSTNAFTRVGKPRVERFIGPRHSPRPTGRCHLALDLK